MHNRKPQPGPTIGAGAGLVGAVETVEDVRQVFGGDALAAVADGDLGLGADDAQAEVDPACGRRVADGVLDQIDQGLAQTVGVAEDDNR